MAQEPVVIWICFFAVLNKRFQVPEAALPEELTSQLPKCFVFDNSSASPHVLIVPLAAIHSGFAH